MTTSDRVLPDKVYSRLHSIHKRKHYCEVVAVYPGGLEMSVAAAADISPTGARSKGQALEQEVTYLTSDELRRL